MEEAKFREQRVGEEFDGLIVSVTKFGMSADLEELFVEGLGAARRDEWTITTCTTSTPRSSGSAAAHTYSWAIRSA